MSILLTAFLSGCIAFLLLVLAVACDNWRALRRLDSFQHDGAWPFVSILLPARNEAANLRACVESLLAQRYPNFELLVLDDDSTDATPAILRALAARDARVQVMAGRPVPPGWLGKHWACQQLAEQARGELLLFTDADTRHAPNALRAAVAALLAERADLVSALPRQALGTWGERLIVPLLPWSVFSFYPRRLARRWPGLALAVGQFMLFRREAYLALGGHGAVRADVADDIALARRLAAHGGRGCLLDAGALVTCRMYHNFDEAFQGFSKNLSAAFGQRALLVVAVWLWLGAAFIAPLAVLPVCLLAGGPWALCLAAVALALAVWAVCAARLRLPGRVPLLYPAIVGLGLVLALRSLRLARTGRAVWKDRPVPAAW